MTASAYKSRLKRSQQAACGLQCLVSGAVARRYVERPLLSLSYLLLPPPKILLSWSGL
jgi:hypothetical protein